MVRFLVHPQPGHDELEVVCTAPLLDRREVASSNGSREIRAVIATTLLVAGHRWPIELTLTNRAAMTYRMLLGRQAMAPGVLVDPAASFHQPRLNYRVYPRREAGRTEAQRALSIALVTRHPHAPSVARLETAARKLGHRLDVLDVAELELALDGSGGLLLRGAVVPAYDAVLPRLGAGKGAAFADACVRQLEAAGAMSPISADALDRLRNRALVAQVLDRVRLASSLKRLGDADKDALPEAEARILRCLVVDGHVAAIAEASGSDLVADRSGLAGAVPKAARRAAVALGLGLAAVDIDEATTRVLAVSAQPALGRFARCCGVDGARLAIAAIEARVRGGQPADSGGATEDADA